MTNIPINKEEEEIANKESVYLFGYLRKKYCNENVKDLDIILNSLCFALLRLIHLHVPKKDRDYLLESVVFPILKKGIQKELG